MASQSEGVHVVRAQALSFRSGGLRISIVGDEPPPDAGPGPAPPIRIGLRLGAAGPPLEFELDEHINRAAREGRDVIIHIMGPET